MRNKNPIDRVFNEINKIVRHYTCPDSCKSICCQYSPIMFERDEYQKILNNIDTTSKEIIETQSTPSIERGFHRELPSGVCPLLHGSKCSIYDNRPMVCQRYPIEVSIHRDIMIRPCGLGIDVILDYMCFTGDAAGASEIYNERLRIENSEVPTIAYVIGSLQDGYKSLHAFTKYLNKTTPENRELARLELMKLMK